MGKIKDNVITRGFSGKFGEDLMFRQVDNKTIFAKRRLVSSAPTAGQTEVRNRFTQATMFASAAMDNPQASVEYKLMAELLGLKSAYLAAVTDYLTYPEIGGVYAEDYRGTIGDMINIKVKVPYKVVGIQVSILLPDGSTLESGDAVANQLAWRFTATAANPQVVGSKLVMTAYDRRGKESVLEHVLTNTNAGLRRKEKK
jgi:hypothetical protein